MTDEFHNLVATINIGKDGFTEGVAQQINEQIETQSPRKIKLLKSCVMQFERKEVAQQIEENCNVVVLKVIGNTIVVTRK